MKSALSSLALMFADPKETGTLMSALALFHIMFSQILGPFLFNGVFACVASNRSAMFIC